MKKLFAGIVGVDERARTVTASAAIEGPWDESSLAGLAGRDLLDARDYAATGEVVSVRFPVQTQRVRDEQTGEVDVVSTTRVVVTARITDDAEWAKVLEGVYVGVSLGPTAAGLVDVPTEHGATEAKLAKIASSAALIKADLARLERRLAYVSALLAKIERPAGANGTPTVNLIYVGRGGAIDLDAERTRAAAQALAKWKT